MSNENLDHHTSPPTPPVAAPISPEQPGPAHRARRLPLGRILAAVVAVAIVFAVWMSVRSEAKPLNRAEANFSVPVARVVRQDLFNEVTIPAEFRPYVEVDVHAKVSGFVREVNVDFGDHVKAGQLLATLEVPELEAELQNAIAAQQRAEADYTNAHLIYNRLSTVNKQHPNLVALQDLDTASAKDLTAAAAIAAARAEVEKYKTMIDYTRITAPFDGVITKRYADPGALIQAGTASATQSLPLVRVSDNYRLRLDFPVSVAYVKDVRIGDSVEVRVDSLGGKTLSGSITRTMAKVNEDTRTMITEIEVPNPKLELVPGMYAAVDLKVEGHPHVLTVPVESVSSGKKPSVYVVNDKGEIEERPVTLGLETSTHYEVVNGVHEGERVLIGSRSLVKPGQKVEAKLVGSLAQQ